MPVLAAMYCHPVFETSRKYQPINRGHRTKDRPEITAWPTHLTKTAPDPFAQYRPGQLSPADGAFWQRRRCAGGAARFGDARRWQWFRAAPESGDRTANWTQARELGARHIFLDDGDYPALLAEIDNGPAVLIMAIGDLAPGQPTVIAMVGARNASAAACRFARQIWRWNWATPGSWSHPGLRAVSIPPRIWARFRLAQSAVIAGGIDIAYPPENADLQRAVAEKGLLIAEMPPGTEPRARHFPHRNRIIAGLALGTVVVEAVPKSGSLITARLAGEYGREVMAVPGSPLDPRARGCNQLIREGATLVQDAGEILELVRPLDLRMAVRPVRPLPARTICCRGGRTRTAGSRRTARDELCRSRRNCPPIGAVIANGSIGVARI